MKIEDILAALPSKEDIAGAVGLEPQTSPSGDMLRTFGIFGAGIILGAGLALVFAPKAGDAIRHDIVEKVGEVGNKLRVEVPHPAMSANVPSV
jgi:hypothetical protein